jgi:hypothetical protein
METRHHHLLLLGHAALVLASTLAVTARAPEQVEPQRPMTPRVAPRLPPPGRPGTIEVVPSPWLNDPDRIFNRFTFNGQEWTIVLCDARKPREGPLGSRGGDESSRRR